MAYNQMFTLDKITRLKNMSKTAIQANKHY